MAPHLRLVLLSTLLCATAAFKFRPVPSETDATSFMQTSSSSHAVPIKAHQLKAMTAQKCKVMCQRFGMKALASLNSKFKGITNPTDCLPVCDEAFGAVVGLSKEAVPAKPTDPKSKR
eukprot:TRINITY_DN582_c0_g1_i1.p1 TRINITY_DN582_c0_g1~~TRINITY_DN582_c0_g1_i1.p1  ORF type:complete len:118 (+),score=26.76 TRINITY_DN582_c0_g1_i1:107-460(+)